ncbi:MAG: YqgE/AlgH family protein [Gammaproteobacteria bacterium]|nr:YqgE/AlgH family protein [Gammaproteobacteria bacterium]
MTESSFLKGHFLIAMPSLQDPNFIKSVTYILEHNDEGAFGLVINQKTDATIAEVLEQLKISVDDSNPYLAQKVFLGGPVDVERGLILHRPVGNWGSTIIECGDIAVTSSLDIMRAIAENQAPEKFMICLGYAGWGPGQLEEEMMANTWLSGPASPEIIFDLPVEQRWQAAANQLGVDLTLLSNDIGHA